MLQGAASIMKLNAVDLFDFIRSLHLPSLRLTWTEAALVAGTLYLGLVQLLRWRRYNDIHQQYGQKYRESKLTPQDAQRIIRVSSVYDMPTLLSKALGVALFKTYGIPSISKLLARTKQVNTPQTIAKRFADTEILIGTWFGCPISGFAESSVVSDDDAPADDPRAMIAIARTNFLHSKYKISNEDYLYTLSVFILEPIRFSNLYGWRSLSPMESESFYIFWAEVGRKMGIREIPQSLREIEAWSIEYEETHMIPDQTNKDLADINSAHVLRVIPQAFGLRTFMKKFMICLMEERLRLAMMMPSQPRSIHLIASIIMTAMWSVQRWLLLPRLSPRFPVVLDLPNTGADPCPRLYPNKFRTLPWYKPESSGLGYYLDKLLVTINYYEEMPGPHLKSSGYRLEEVGPTPFENSGHEEVMRIAEKLQGRPITGPWSLQSKSKLK